MQHVAAVNAVAVAVALAVAVAVAFNDQGDLVPRSGILMAPRPFAICHFTILPFYHLSILHAI